MIQKLLCRCVGEVRKLAAGGGHSAVLTDAFSLKELCEFTLANNVNLSNASEIEDVALRTGSDALARLCGRLRYTAFLGTCGDETALRLCLYVTLSKWLFTFSPCHRVFMYILR